MARWGLLLPLLAAALACGTAVTDTAYYICPTPTPRPLPTVLPGTLPPPLAPLPTPYTIAPPQDFYVDDDVLVGLPNAPTHLRFRLQRVQLQPAGPHTLVTWQLEITNLGTATYETVPPALMTITRITTAHGLRQGTWPTSDRAMRAAGVTHDTYDPLPPGATRIYRLAAFIPAGSPDQFTYLLDPASGNRITWHPSPNPHCTGGRPHA